MNSLVSRTAAVVPDVTTFDPTSAKMPLSSPNKSNNSRADVNAKQQAQIQELTAQRDQLVRQYMAALGAAARADHAAGTLRDGVDERLAPSIGAMPVEVPPTPSVDTQTDQAQFITSEAAQEAVSQSDIEDTVTHANNTLKTHIKLLHDYNEMKDMASALVGLIADQRGVKIVDVMEEMGIAEGD